MLLSTMVNQIFGTYGNRFQVDKATILSNISEVQKMAFSSNIENFLRWDVDLTLVADSVDPTKMSKGPYPFEDDCRAILGITTLTDSQILSSTATVSDYSTMDFNAATPWEQAFNGKAYNPGVNPSIFVTCRIDQIGRTFKFADYPSDSKTYRVVYYRRPFDLLTVNDNDKVIIPEEWHDQVLVQGAIAMCDRENYGTDAKTFLIPILEPFWAAMRGDRPSEGNDEKSSGAW